MVLAFTFEFIPPPTTYFTVRVVLAGTWPYALVFKKLEGSKAVFNLLLPSLIPNPILSGLGIICSSALLLLPAPNWISN